MLVVVEEDKLNEVDEVDEMDEMDEVDKVAEKSKMVAASEKYSTKQEDQSSGIFK